MIKEIKAPQANNVDTLIKLTDSLDSLRSKEEILNTILKNFDKRQYLYYFDALVFLGLAVPFKYNKSVTYKAPDDVLKKIKEYGGEKILIEAINKNKYFKIFQNDEEQAIEALKNDFSLAPSTLKRRVSTFRSWMNFIKERE